MSDLLDALLAERFAPRPAREPEPETADDDVTCARRRKALDEAFGVRERKVS